MRGTAFLSLAWLIALVGVAMLEVPAYGQWTNAARLNDAGEAGVDVKSAKVAASVNGGFHAMYHSSNQNSVQYKRWQNSVLGGGVTAHSGFNFNGAIAEARNGDIHILFENWASGGPEIGWVVSKNGGASFTSSIDISASSKTAKHPHITALGLGASDDALMSYYRSGSTGGGSKQLFSRKYDGANWGPETPLNTSVGSEFEVFGMGWSPLDGSVYRSFDNGAWLGMRQYNGSNWGGTINLDNSGFSVRQRLAVNDAGQVMVLWDQDGKYWSILYTPGVGAGEKKQVSSQASWGTSLCAIPGTNNFYTAYAKNDPHPGRLWGRKWAGGGWLAEEQISHGLADDFTVGPDVAAAQDGSGEIYCVWEYWGSGKPQQYYAIRPSVAPGPKGTLAGVCRDNVGALLPGVTVNVNGVDATVSQADGTFSLEVPVGAYGVTATKNHYSAVNVNNVSIVANQTTQLPLTLNPNVPGLVTNLIAIPSNQSNIVSWTNPGSPSLTGVMVRYGLDTYPGSPTDGQLLIDKASAPGANDAAAHNGLFNGQKVFYGVFSYFDDASRHYSAARVTTGTPFGPADFDHDGDVDQNDYGFFQRCYSGSSVPQPDPTCMQARLDGDGDVDQNDFGIFQGCYSGADLPADPNCAN